MTPEGWYEGEIVSTRIEPDKDENLVLCFDVRLNGDEGHAGTCRHATVGKPSEWIADLAAYFNTDWPYGLVGAVQADEYACRAVRVRVKHNTSQKGQTFENWYIATGKGSGAGEPASKELVQRRLAELARATGVAVRGEDDEDIPF